MPDDLIVPLTNAPLPSQGSDPMLTPSVVPQTPPTASVPPAATTPPPSNAAGTFDVPPPIPAPASVLTAPNTLENLAEAVKTSGAPSSIIPPKTAVDQPFSEKGSVLPPQVESSDNAAQPLPQPNTDQPLPEKKSGKKKAVIGVLLLLLIIIPVTAYFASQQGIIANILNFAKIPPEFGGEGSGLPNLGSSEKNREANKQNEAAFQKDANKPAQGGAGAGSSPGNLIAQGTLSSGGAGPLFQAWALAHGGSFVVTTGANGCPSGCTEFIGAYPTMEAAQAAIAAAGGGTFQIDNASTGEYTSYQKEGTPKGSTGERVVRDDTKKITTVVTASPTPIPIIPTTIPTTVPTSVPTEVPTSVPTSVPTIVPTTMPATPTAIPGSPYCDASCGQDSDCPSGLICATVTGIKRCRNSACVSYSNCTCPSTPMPTTVIATPGPTVVAQASTPKTPVSGVPSVLGAATIGGGILLLLLGLLL